MSNDTSAQACPECGARIVEGADRCGLCGIQFAAPQVEEQVEDTSADATTCKACNHKNRPDAVFCDQCATPLGRSAGPTPNPVPKKRVKKPPKKKFSKTGKKATSGSKAKPRVGLLLVGGVVVVAVLYGITVMSQSGSSVNTAEPPAQVSGTSLDEYFPEDDGLRGQSSAIRSSAEEETDPAREIALRQQLVELYAANGRLDLAGREQTRVAELQNTATDWAAAGNLHFDWMEQQSGPERIKAAQRSAAAYVKSLELEPDDLDVRTDLGVAYLNDPAGPMPAIRETNAVLEADSNHVQANFNKGVMLIQIGRRDEALKHFEKVKTLSEPGSPAHDRAVAILEQVGTSIE